MPFLYYSIGVSIMVVAMLSISYVLGQRHSERATNEVYESGMLITGSARVRVSSDYYLIAMFFVIFDLEAIFIFSWAVAAKELGWNGYFVMLVFVVLLVIPFLYLWKTGGLNFGPKLRRPQPRQLGE